MWWGQRTPQKNKFKCRWKHVVFDILCIRCREAMEGRGRTMHREGGFKVGNLASAPSKSIEEALRWTQGRMPLSRNKLATTISEMNLKATKQTCNEYSKRGPINLKPCICQTLKFLVAFWPLSCPILEQQKKDSIGFKQQTKTRVHVRKKIKISLLVRKEKVITRKDDLTEKGN